MVGGSGFGVGDRGWCWGAWWLGVGGGGWGLVVGDLGKPFSMARNLRSLMAHSPMAHTHMPHASSPILPGLLLGQIISVSSSL